MSKYYIIPLHLSHVEAMMTMKIMGLDAEYEESLAYLKDNLDFDKDMAVNHFEITIRYALHRDKSQDRRSQRIHIQSGTNWNADPRIRHASQADRTQGVLRQTETRIDGAVQPQIRDRIGRL